MGKGIIPIAVAPYYYVLYKIVKTVGGRADAAEIVVIIKISLVSHLI